MESVVAVASEEEERHGVAASLLAALIPPEVKVAEEKWRKRLLGHLEEGENGMDSDGETCGPAGSPSTPLRDSESLPVAPKEPRSKNQSQESSDAEEETEEDTVELELALERKKVKRREKTFTSRYILTLDWPPSWYLSTYLESLSFLRRSCGLWRKATVAQGAPARIRRPARKPQARKGLP